MAVTAEDLIRLRVIKGAQPLTVIQSQEYIDLIPRNLFGPLTRGGLGLTDLGKYAISLDDALDD